MTKYHAEKETNILDLAGFRSKKQSAFTAHTAEETAATFNFSKKELGTHIENIKKSIQRINKLMEELRTISEKPNKT